MRKVLLSAAFVLCSVSVTTRADVVAMPAATESAPAAATAPPALPVKGQKMAAVVKQFGEPATKHAAVGGDAPRHPRITRWDYSGFSVFFEHGHVIDAVTPDHPAEIHHSEELKPAQ
jgi:hypothetical protein